MVYLHHHTVKFNKRLQFMNFNVALILNNWPFSSYTSDVMYVAAKQYKNVMEKL